MATVEVYKAKLEFLEAVLGTAPKDPDIYDKYIASKNADPVEAKAETEMMKEALGEGEAEQGNWTVFRKDAGGIFIYGYQVSGFFKEAADISKGDLKLKNGQPLKNHKSKLDKWLYIRPRQIRFLTDRSLVAESLMVADGVNDRTLRAMTMQGPRVTLVRSDVVNPGRCIEFEMHLFKQGEITGDMLYNLLCIGEYKGIGQFRNGSYGQFKVLAFDAQRQRNIGFESKPQG